MSVKPPPVTYGSRVRLHYAMVLPDGSEIVSTYADEPLLFTLGDGTMETPLELALIGLRPGDEQTLQVSGSEIYGAVDPDNQQWIERGEFPTGMELREGQIIGFTTPEGDTVAGAVTRIEPARILLDFNHPLSGRSFDFKVTILEVMPPE
jgi:FKBP-type peptidyl-prolyl cis-trans isomerase SlpA